MASDPPSPGKGKVKGEKRRRKRKEQQREFGDIEELTSTGHKALEEGRLTDALSCFKDALKAATQLHDSRVLRACSLNLGAAYVEAGQPRRGLDLLQRTQPGPKADRLPDLQYNLALAYKALGQDQEAAAHFLQAAQLFRSQGDMSNEGHASTMMSLCHSRTQDYSQTAQGFLRAAESYRLAAMLDSAAVALKQAGSFMVQSEEFKRDDIMEVLGECLSLTDSVADSGILADLYLSVGVAYCQLRCFQEAVPCLQQALNPAAQQPPLLAKVLHNLGAALNNTGEFTSAKDYHRLAAGLYGSLGCRGPQAQCFSNLGFACAQLGDEEEAAESFILSLQGFRDTEDHLAEVQVCESLAEIYMKQHKQQKSVQLYKQALRALCHCKDAAGLQDRLVERLTAALRLTVQRPRPLLPRLHTQRPHPHSSPLTRKSDITQSPSATANQRADTERGAGQGVRPRLETAGVGGASDTPGDSSVELGENSLSQCGQQQQQLGQLGSDRDDPPTDSDTSLVQHSETPPTSKGDLGQVTSPLSRWRSRFCALM